MKKEMLVCDECDLLVAMPPSCEKQADLRVQGATILLHLVLQDLNKEFLLSQYPVYYYSF